MTASRLGRVIRTALVAALLLGLAATAGATWLARRSFPRTQGVQQVPGLEARVDVYRSPQGVPHIYASNEHDLFFAQGYVHAQDRFWQMDFFRHVGAGRLAEMFGSSQVDTDIFLRTMGWERIAEQEYEQVDGETRGILEAYAEGVNAYLADRRGSAASLEYAILGLLNPDYEIEPWTPVNTLTWGKAMAWDLGSNMDEEIDRAMLLQEFTRAQIEELYPPYPQAHPVIFAGAADRASDELERASVPRAALPALRRVGRGAAELDRLLGANSPSIGSNNWTVAPARSDSGAAMLANDTHLGIQMPSIWYEIGLHCRPVSDRCRFTTTGFSFAGVPLVVIGHNGRIAWGVTNLGSDVQDLYIERLNPEDAEQYEVDGEWVDMETLEEQVHVAGEDPVSLTVRLTHHGPIISDSYGPLEGFGEHAGVEVPEHYAISLRWTALEPSSLFQAVVGINLAPDRESFRTALRDWDVPSQNFVYADAEGNIGYQMPGKIPVRGAGIGWLPAPGWDSSFDWQGYIPYEEQPSLVNPQQGFITTANHAVVDESFAYYVEREWDYGYRAQRINELLQSDDSLTPDDLAAIQGDNFNPMGPVFVPRLAQLSYDAVRLRQFAAWLGEWDHRNHMDSAKAALFNAFWRQLLVATFADQLEEEFIPGGSRAYFVMQTLADQPDSEWWDDRGTEARETRDDILRRALAAALEDVESHLGQDESAWRWGDLHTATFRNQSLGESGVAPIEALFNRGAFPTSGGASIVNATSWDAVEGYEVTSLPSQRFIVDFADLDRTRAVHATGQSGHAFHPHYIDQAEPWRQIEFHDLQWSFEAVVSSAAAHLQLEP